LDEVSREKLLVKLIAEQWDNKERKFVNLHQVYGDLRVLIFAYADVFKVKRVNTED
jgi:hypothetical protein